MAATTHEGHHNTQWDTIRPWIDRLSLQPKELTSVSATFLLTSLGHSASSGASGEDLTLLGVEPDESLIPHPRSNRSLREVLHSRRLSVKVNGNPWQKVVPHIEDNGNEAVIILYGLMPGRSYDVELGITPDAETFRGRIQTPQAEETPVQNAEQEDDNTKSISSSSSRESSPSPELALPVTPESSSPPRTITLEERLTQVRSIHASVTNEHDALVSRLKMARKDSQRSISALRAEIDSVKRTVDKQIAADQRAKQKVLALQEMVKQTHALTLDMDAQARSVEADLPRLRQDEAVIALEHANVKEKADRKQAEVEEIIQIEKRRTADAQNEISAVSNRLEKITAKRDKLSVEAIPELEQQLADILKEIEELERFQDQPYVESPGHDISLSSFNGIPSQPSSSFRNGNLRQPPIQRPNPPQVHPLRSAPALPLAFSLPKSMNSYPQTSTLSASATMSGFPSRSSYPLVMPRINNYGLANQINVINRPDARSFDPFAPIGAGGTEGNAPHSQNGRLPLYSHPQPNPDPHLPRRPSS